MSETGMLSQEKAEQELRAVQLAAEAGTRLFPVVEGFVSINGEGPRAGRLAAFMRFRGCTLSCSYCDTVWANGANSAATMLSVADIVDYVDAAGVDCVTLTGGEPLLQDGIEELLVALARSRRRFVEIETNGAVPLAYLASLRRELRRQRQDGAAGWHFTMDCKLPSSGMDARMVPENYALLDWQDTVKFVIGSAEDFPVVVQTIRQHSLDERCQVHLSPVHRQMPASEVVDFMRREGLASAELHLQLHKYVWPERDRGV